MLRLLALALLLLGAGPSPTAWGQTGFVVDTAVLPPTTGTAPFQSISFVQPFEPGVVPVVVVLPMDDCPPAVTARPPPNVSDCEPAAVRIRNVTEAGFEAVQIEPPDGSGQCARWGRCNASHTSTMFSYLAAAPGAFTLPDGTQVEAGRVVTSTSQDGISGGGSPPNGWVDVPFSVNVGGSPVVLATLQTLVNEQGLNGSGSRYNDSSRPFLDVAIRDITGTGGANGFGQFETAVELSEVRTGVGPGGLTSPETIGWIAFPDGVRSTLPDGNGNDVAWGTLATGRNINGFEADNGAAPNQCYTNTLTGLPGSITSPIALAQKRSRFGPNGGWFRRCSLASSGSSITVGVAMDEDTDQDIERQHQGTEAASIAVFGGPLVTTPVSLALFESEARGDELTVSWVVASETSNAGFHVLGREPGGAWTPLHDELVPSRRVDQRSPEAYRITVALPPEVTELALEDRDLRGRATRRGPFPVGERQGAVPRTVATDWKAARRTLRPARPKQRSKAARLFVDRAGIQRVTHEALLAGGVDLTGIEVADLALFDEARAVPRYVGGGSLWGTDSFVEFVGAARDSLYGRENAYVLTVDPERARGAEIEAQPFQSGALRRAERTRIERAPANAYGFSSPFDDPWFDVELGTIGGRPRSATRSFTVDDALSGRGTIEVSLWGLTDLPEVVDHRIRVRFNGEPVTEREFDGAVAARVRAPVTIVPGSNDLVVEVVDGDAPFSIVGLDSVALEYDRLSRADGGRWARPGVSRPGTRAARERLFSSSFEPAASFEIAGFSSPEVVAWVADGARRVLPEARTIPGAGASFAITLRFGVDELAMAAEVQALALPRVEAGVIAPATPARDADYLVIGPPPLLAGAAPIAERQRRAGHSVALVDVAAIYARYSDHVLDAEAVRAFIAESFAGRFGYVLLLGDDTFDYRDDLGLGSVSFVPTLYTTLSRIIRYGPSDALLGDTDGDGLPDVAVGRLPVRSREELDAWIAKAEAAANQSGPALFAADRRVVLTERPDEFSRQSQLLEQAFGGSVEVAYHNDLGAAGVAAALRDAFAARRPLVNFSGHSSFDRLSFDRVLDVPIVQGLGPGELVGLLTAWGCWNSYFVQPDFDELGSALLRQPGAGAVNVIGATTLIDGDASLALGVYFFERLRRPGTTIGRALIEARHRLARDLPGSIDAVLGITVLGDPATLPQADR